MDEQESETRTHGGPRLASGEDGSPMPEEAPASLPQPAPAAPPQSTPASLPDETAEDGPSSAPPLVQSEEADGAEQRDARPMWLVATALLALSATLFAATFLDPDPGFWTTLVRRVTEASVAGGMADWFAVVALFRRPLGLPIPHTAVIPRNKERIARGISRFVERHFLNSSAVAARLRTADLAGLVATWLSRPENAAAVADRSAEALAAVVAGIPEEELKGFVRAAALRGISSLDVAPLLSQAAEIAYETGRHQQLYDYLLGEARGWLAENPRRLQEIVAERTAWWVPQKIDRRLADLVADEAATLLDRMAAPEADARREFDTLIRHLITELRTSERWRERAEGVKCDILASERLHEALDHAADELRRLTLEAMSERRSAVRETILQIAQAFARRLATDEDLRRRLERRVVWLARSSVEPWRPGIGRFMADVVRGWDARTVADRLEALVGRDLQYVRINGTLVGGFIGGVLFLITHWAG